MDCKTFFKAPMKRGLLLQIAGVETNASKAGIPVEVDAMLQEFSQVFKTSIELPPLRGHEHSIVLKEGAQPICQRPYRYPFYQKKNEIEKIVKELLLVGSIRNSSSPFTSHVLLVKKVDGSWRMCIDYKALNSIIVKDNFQSQLLMSCWMNCMGLLLFPS